MAESAEVKSGTSSVEVSKNAKGELSYKVKVYEGTTQGEADELARIAVATMEGLTSGRY